MKLFIPRVPKGTTKNELKTLIQTAMDKKFHIPFTKRASIISCDVLHIKDNNGVEDYHGLVEISCDLTCKWMIKLFRRKKLLLHNKQVFARQYVERVNNDDESFSSEDDRRRPNLSIEKDEKVKLSVEASEKFRRKHGV